MSRVRVLVGAQKGAFILTSDAGREHREVAASRPVHRVPHEARRDHGATLWVRAEWTTPRCI